MKIRTKRSGYLWFLVSHCGNWRPYYILETRTIIHFSFSLIFSLYINSHMDTNRCRLSSTVALSNYSPLIFEIEASTFGLSSSNVLSLFSITYVVPNQIKSGTNSSIPIWFHILEKSFDCIIKKSLVHVRFDSFETKTKWNHIHPYRWSLHSKIHKLSKSVPLNLPYFFPFFLSLRWKNETRAFLFFPFPYFISPFLLLLSLNFLFCIK